MHEKMKSWIKIPRGQQKAINLHVPIAGNEVVICSDAEYCEIFQSTAKNVCWEEGMLWRKIL